MPGYLSEIGFKLKNENLNIFLQKDEKNVQRI